MALDTHAGFVAYLLRRADENPDGTSPFEAWVPDLLAEKSRELYTLHPWLGLLAYPPQAFIAPAAITTLTLTVAANATAATLSAAPPTAGQDITNWWVLPNGETYLFRISTFTPNGVNLTLDAAAPEALAARACTIVQMEFSLLANTGPLADQLWTDGGGVDGAVIPVRAEEEIRLHYPGRPDPGWPPAMAARIAPARVRLSGYDTTPHRVEVPYYQEPPDPSASSFVWPAYLRPLLLESSLSLLYEMKGDDRRSIADARYAAGLSKAKEYDSLLRAGLGAYSNSRRNAPYGEARSPYA